MRLLSRFAIAPAGTTVCVLLIFIVNAVLILIKSLLNFLMTTIVLLKLFFCLDYHNFPTVADAI